MKTEEIALSRVSENEANPREISQANFQKLVQYFDARFSSEELEAIKILERTHFYRVFYYARKLGRVDVANRLIEHFNTAEI